VSIKSQIEACNIELREVENLVSFRRAELEQLELRLEMQKLSSKVCVVAPLCFISQMYMRFSAFNMCVTYCKSQIFIGSSVSLF